jgi:hypothetical protein
MVMVVVEHRDETVHLMDQTGIVCWLMGRGDAASFDQIAIHE